MQSRSPESVKLPEVWGPGILFSGLTTYSAPGLPIADDTDESANSAEAAGDPLLFLTGRELGTFYWLPLKDFRLTLKSDRKPEIIRLTGGTFSMEGDGFSLKIAFASPSALIGSWTGPVEVTFQKVTSGNQPERVTERQGAFILTENKFSLATGSSMNEAKEEASGALRDNLEQAYKRALWIHIMNPVIPSHGIAELYNKCLSLLQHPGIPGQYALPCGWSDPVYQNRHRPTWTWELIIHSLGLDLYHTPSAEKVIAQVLSHQREDGMIPHCMHNQGCASAFTHPPVLAWALWQNFDKGENPAKLRRLLPKIERGLLWNLKNRDRNGNGLLEWSIQKVPSCLAGESGMENSSRFDARRPLDCVDFSVLQARDMYYASLIAAELGHRTKAKDWHDRYAVMAQKIHQCLWNPETGFYHDRLLADGELAPTRSVTGLYPLLLPDLPLDNLQQLIDKIRDKAWFGSRFPLPTIALNDPSWCLLRHRGATWLQSNFMVIQGLRLHGVNALATEVKEKSLEIVNHIYRETGTVRDFFDPSGQITLDKNGIIERQSTASQRDETPDRIRLQDSIQAAAITLCMIQS